MWDADSVDLATTRRMQRARFALFVVCFAWLAVTILNLHRGLVGAAQIDIAVIVVTLLCYAGSVVRPNIYRYAVHLAIFVSVAGLVAVSYFHGQSRSHALWFVALAPLAAVYLLDYRSSLKWAAFCSLLMLGVDVWRRVAPAPEAVAEQSAAVILRIVVLTWLVLGILLAVGRSQTQQLRELQDREQTIQTLADDLKKQSQELAAMRDQLLLAAKAKSEFLSVMSHEIRTPLNAVIGLAGVLADAPLDPRERDVVRTIRSSGDALLSLLNDCLDFSKIEAKKLTLEAAPFDLVTCTEEALDMFAGAAAEKQIGLECIADRTVPTLISGDVARVRQVIVNLVSNGVKFTERGSVVVRLSAARTDAPKQTVLTVSVYDTGIGVAQDEIRTLFQPFLQADSSITRRFGGTGLGLAISYGIAQLMGGTLSAESEVGRGSVFRFSFSAEIVEEAVEPPSSTASMVAVLSPYQSTREAVSRHCESAGFFVRSFDSIEQARIGLTNAVPRAFLVDDHFDLESVEDIIPALEHPIPWIVLSASVWNPKRGLSRSPHSNHVAAVLPKPVRRAAVRDALEEALGSDAPRVTSHEPPRRSGLRVLVAEDNLVNQKVLLLLLERLGHHVDVALNGLQAVEATLRQSYDLVLMDVCMPEMDGLEATRRIRKALPGAKGPRIIAVTANVAPSDEVACRDAGMDDFMGKPVRPKILERMIQRWSQLPEGADKEAPGTLS